MRALLIAILAAVSLAAGLLARQEWRQSKQAHALAVALEGVDSVDSISFGIKYDSRDDACPPTKPKAEEAFYAAELQGEMAISRFEQLVGPGHYAAVALRKQLAAADARLRWEKMQCLEAVEKAKQGAAAARARREAERLAVARDRQAEIEDRQAEIDMLLTRRTLLRVDVEVFCSERARKSRPGICEQKQEELAGVEKRLRELKPGV